MSWSIHKKTTLSDVSTEEQLEYDLSQEGVWRIKVSFANSGTAVFYATGSYNDAGEALDTIGYLCTSLQTIDSDTGEPEEFDKSDDDSGTEEESGSEYNFRIEYDVESETTYYLFVRHCYSSSSGNIGITIIPPVSEEEEDIPNFDNVELATYVDGTNVEIELYGLDWLYSNSKTWNTYWSVRDMSSYAVIYSEQIKFSAERYVLELNANDGVSLNTEYQVVVSVNYYDSYGGLQSGKTVSDTFTTGGGEDFNEDNAQLNLSSSTDGKTITAYVSGLNTSYPRSDRYIVWSLDGEPLDSVTYIDAWESTSDAVTWTNLTPGQTYLVSAAIWVVVDGVGKPVSWPEREITTNESVTIDGAYVEFGGNTGTTITVSVKGLDTSYGRNDRYIYWSIGGVEKSPVSLSSGVPQSNPYTFTGLSPSTNYTIGARITYTSGGTTYEKYLETVSCSTANWASEQQSGLGTISSTKTTNWTLRKATIFYASVKFSQSGNVTISSSGSYDTYGYLTTGTPSFNNSSGVPSNYVANNDDDGDGSNFSLTHAVEAGVTYYIWVRGYSTSTSVGTITLNVSFSNRPAKFQWADGTTEKMPRQEFDITADEWCDLLDNINAVRKYKGYSEFPKGSYTETYYYNYFTYPTPGQPFRYQHYNQALNAITGMLGDGYDDNAVKQKDPVTAAKINLLVEWLNGIT